MDQATGAVCRVLRRSPHALKEKVFFYASPIGINIGQEYRDQMGYRVVVGSQARPWRG